MRKGQREDREKFRRVLGHRNTTGRTVLQALEVRGRRDWAGYVRGVKG